MFSKVDVNGPNEHPLFTFLKKEKPGALGTKSIKWNFTKFLVGRDGQVLKRYGSSTTPDDIDADVVAALAEGPA
jgi:glutathione peroxidase